MQQGAFKQLIVDMSGSCQLVLCSLCSAGVVAATMAIILVHINAWSTID